MVMGDSIGIKNLQQALARWTGQNMDVGVATGGTNTTADDTLKDWPVNKWAGGQVRIIKANGQEYDRAIASNTATQLTLAGLPGIIVVAAGDIYSIKTSAAITDITDRWTRLLGQIDLARVLGAVLSHANPVIARLSTGAAFDITLPVLALHQRWGRAVDPSWVHAVEQIAPGAGAVLAGQKELALTCITATA